MDTHDATTTSGELRVLGRRLHYVSRGSGPTVLLVHGLGATSHIWEHLEMPGFRLVAVDLPGCGESEARHGPQGPREFAALLDEFMERLAPGPYVVLGHSLGALVALELGLLHPGRVRGLMLFNVPIRLPRLVRLSSAPLLGEAIYRVPTLAPASRLAVRLYLTFIFGNPAKITERMVDDYARVSQSAGYYGALLVGLRGLAAWAHGERVGKLAVPCSIVWGDRDRMFPLALGRRLAQSLPHAQFHRIEGCGHSPPEEAPEQVSALARSFLESLPAADAVRG